MACMRSVVNLTVSSPVGDICITSCHDGLHSVHQTGSKDANFTPDANVAVTIKEEFSNEKLHTPVDNAIEWLRTYFHHPESIENIIKPTICKSILKGNFQDNVWRTLADKVQFGSTISYIELANLTNHSKAARAVGTAMKMNPISIIIPCHRVIRTGGSIGFYANGSHVKKWLLQHENINIKS